MKVTGELLSVCLTCDALMSLYAAVPARHQAPARVRPRLLQPGHRVLLACGCAAERGGRYLFYSQLRRLTGVKNSLVHAPVYVTSWLRWMISQSLLANDRATQCTSLLQMANGSVVVSAVSDMGHRLPQLSQQA